MVVDEKQIKYEGRTVFSKYVMSSDFRRIPKYFTEDEACFLFITKGEFQFRTPTNLLSFNASDSLLAKCGNYYFEQPVEADNKDKTFEVIGAYFYPDIVKEFFKTDISLTELKKDFDVVKIDIQPLMKTFIESVSFILDNPQLADKNLITAKMKELIILLSKSESWNSINSFISSLFSPLHYNYQEVIQKNLYVDLSLEELAHLCGMSLSTFKRTFSENYGTSPAQYIKSKRLEKARELLRTTSLRITEICYECGFNSLGHFSKSFISTFGYSPSEYRSTPELN